MFQKIYDDLRSHDVKALLDFEAGACFAAGTLVHTQDGLKPIEKIQVGDMVLSKHESGEGERAYKRVTKTFVHEDAELVRLPYGGRDESGRPAWGDGLLVTPNHPIWIVGKGWTEVGKIKSVSKALFVENIEGSQAETNICQLIYATTNPDIGWIPQSKKSDSLGIPGTLYDVSNNKYVMDEVQPQYSKPAWWGEDRGMKGKKPGKEHLYRARVYNLEVEDFHTYYVGKHGVWVHNKNLQIGLQGGIGLTPRINTTTIFHNSSELYAFLRRNPETLKDSIFIIRSGYESQWLARGEAQPTYAALIMPAHWQTVYNTLANGNFAAGLNQWESTGKVEATPSTVTLGESSTAQAHTSQAFVLNAQDHFLTFNVSNLSLQNNSTSQGSAPQDAFEVALTNANTGANLLPGLRSSHSDALLNIQLASSDSAATLQERATTGLRRTDNPDGSRTNVLDLSSIAAGTLVNLSFDLIGFGLTAAQMGSQVSIKDVRLISTPLAVDDAAALVEDGSFAVGVMANDLSTEATG